MKIVHSRIRTSLLAPMVALPLIASVAFGCRSESEQIMGKWVVDAYAETTLCIGSNTNGSKWVGNKTDVATKLMEFGLIIVGEGLPVAHNEGATVNIRNTIDYGRIEVLDTVIEGSDTDRYKVTYRMLGQERTVDTVKCPEIGGKIRTLARHPISKITLSTNFTYKKPNIPNSSSALESGSNWHCICSIQ